MGRNLVATYRLQLHKDFGFKEAKEVADYIFDLGVSHLYLSPILESVAGSIHGYDVTDPVKISKERGGEKEWRRLLKYLNEHYPDRGIIVDIVPNHIGASYENPYWRDLLENGPSSPYFELFDVHARDLSDEGTHDESQTHELRLVLPSLGASLKEVTSKEEIKIEIDETGFFARYWSTRFPTAAVIYSEIITPFLANLTEPIDQESQEALQALAQEFDRLPRWSQSLSPQERWRRWKKQAQLKKQLWSLLSEDTELQACLREYLGDLDASGVRKLLKMQPYELAFWKEGALRINYRRFFDITDLAALRMEDGQVFDFTHTKVAEIAKEKAVDGLRVDHVDGLWNPRQYLNSLHRLSSQIWVEKILGPGESLPEDWPVMGCTGYEFMNVAQALMVDREGFGNIERAYRESIDLDWESFPECVRKSKAHVFENFFQAEWKRLTEELCELAEENGFSLAREEIAQGLKDITVALPVYRTYLEAVFGGSEHDRRFLAFAFEEWRKWGEASDECIGFFEDAFTGRLGSDSPNLQQWVYRWQQLTGPVMAKGLEDTSFYRDYPLVALSEVGGEGPLAMKEPEEHWQEFVIERMLKQPLALNASSTHDTKRGETVRCRLASIADYSEQWLEFFERFSNAHEPMRGSLIQRNEEWFIYQNLIAAWPASGEMSESFKERMLAYFEKAFREAKRSTSWRAPNGEWESALKDFLLALMDSEQCPEFIEEAQDFAQKLATAGALKELSLLSLKCLSPGVPDFYQGTEIWDDSMVDPDNRRPVDYNLRRELLSQLKKRAHHEDSARFFTEMVRDWKSGQIKLWVSWKLLTWRRLNSEPIERFKSIPVRGEDASLFKAYLREGRSHNVLLILPVKTKSETGELAQAGIDVQIDLSTITGLGVVVEDILRSTQSSDLDIKGLLSEFPVGIFAWRK